MLRIYALSSAFRNYISSKFLAPMLQLLFKRTRLFSYILDNNTSWLRRCLTGRQ